MGFTDGNIALDSDGEGHVDRSTERHRGHRVQNVHVSLQHFYRLEQLCIILYIVMYVVQKIGIARTHLHSYHVLQNLPMLSDSDSLKGAG